MKFMVMGALCALLVGAHASSAFGGIYEDETLARAIEHGDVTLAKEALDAGANPNLVPSGWRYTVLTATVAYMASWSYCNCGTELLELLLSKGADANGRDFEGRTAIGVAAGRGSHVIQTLVRFGADVNVMSQGIYPLELAGRFGDEKNFLDLLNNGADPNVVISGGDRVLHHVIEPWSFRKLGKPLLDKGADPNAVGGSGNNAFLDLLIKYWQQGSSSYDNELADVARYLLAKGWNPNASDSLGRRSLWYAQGLKLTETEWVLKRGGAH